MALISITAIEFRIDENAIKKAILESTRKAMLEAAQEFLLIAAPSVPIDTGMARGSFLNLLHMLQYNGLMGSVPIDMPTLPRRVRKDGKPFTYIHSGGGRYPKTPQTSADKYSTPMAQILKKVGDSYQFKYKIDVVHFGVMDDFNPHGASWKSMVRGGEAFANKLRKFKPIDVSQYTIQVLHRTGTHKTGYTDSTVRRVVT